MNQELVEFLVRKFGRPELRDAKSMEELSIALGASSRRLPGTQKSGWAAVRDTWQKASSLAASLASRISGGAAAEALLHLRILSCHGDPSQGIPACPARVYSDQKGGYHYCNDCGCGQREIARLSSIGSKADRPQWNAGDYTKLSYPYLECPRQRPGFSNAPTESPMKNGLQDFSRIVLINLARRADRRAAFEARALQAGFPAIEVFQAVDGSKVPAPDAWKDGGGAWGCMESHRQILQSSLAAGFQSLLVFEDDCTWRDTVIDELANFLARVPDDWECLMLGGQHMIPAPRVTPGVVRCRNTQRTHAYALRGPVIADLLKLWINYNGHCDHAMGPFMGQRKCYAPDPFIFGQGAGPSDINGKNNPTFFWDAGDYKPPVVWLKNTPRDTVDRLRPLGFHTGHWRDDRGLDRGLDEIMGRGLPPVMQIRQLRPWLDLVSSEARSIAGGKVAIWHPGATEQVLRRVVGEDLVILDNPPVDAAAANFVDKPPKVFYHVAAMGHWREVVREQLELADRVGLREMTVGFLGSSDELAELKAMTPAAVRLEVGFAHADLKLYEWPTLKLLDAWCRDHEGPVLYWHTKGVSVPGAERKTLWRRLMQRELVAKWSEHVAGLYMFDALGVDWLDCATPHFSGNFWITHSRHIRSLPTVEAYQASPRHQMGGPNQDRCGAEFWIGASPCRPRSLVVRNQNLWDTDYLEKLDRRQKCDGCVAH